MMLSNTTRWSHPPDNQVVPSPWQATPPAPQDQGAHPVSARLEAAKRAASRDEGQSLPQTRAQQPAELPDNF